MYKRTIDLGQAMECKIMSRQGATRSEVSVEMSLGLSLLAASASAQADPYPIARAGRRSAATMIISQVASMIEGAIPCR